MFWSVQHNLYFALAILASGEIFCYIIPHFIEMGCPIFVNQPLVLEILVTMEHKAQSSYMDMGTIMAVEECI